MLFMPDINMRKMSGNEKQLPDLPGFNGTEAVKHKLNELQLAEVIAQCNAKSAIAALLAE